MSGICRAAGTLGGVVAVPGAMAGTIEGTTGGVTTTGTEIDAGVVITGNGRLRAGLSVGKQGEGIRSVPFPIGNVYSRMGHRADASPVFSSVANKNFPSLGNGPSYLKTGRSANEVGHKPNVGFQPLPRSIGRGTRASD